MDIEFDFKGDPVGGVITKCKHCQSVFKNKFVFKCCLIRMANQIHFFIADLLEKVMHRALSFN